MFKTQKLFLIVKKVINCFKFDNFLTLNNYW